MFTIDAKGMLKNTSRMSPIFPGIRPTTMIKECCMTSSLLTFDNPISIDESISASIAFITPKYYGNSLWIDKPLEIYEGSKIIGTFIVTEIINPVLDASAEKWICLDGRDIRSLNDFYIQTEHKLSNKIDFKTGRNLNAFNDLLWGGFGIHEYGEPLHIVWIFAEESRQSLGCQCFKDIISIIENHESNNIYLELYDKHAF